MDPRVFSDYLPHIDSICAFSYGIQSIAPTAMDVAGPGYRLTDDTSIVPLDEDDKDQRRALLASAASKRSGSS
jgi:hypothetical protein